jgi:hypothetical protein
MEVDDFATRVKDFLFFGPQASDEGASRAIHATATGLLRDWDDWKKSQEVLKGRLRDAVQRNERIVQMAEPAVTFEKYEKMCLLEAEVIMTRLAASLNDLQAYKDVEDIPRLVSHIIEVAPDSLPEKTTLYSAFSATSTRIGCDIVKKFNTSFEAVLGGTRDENDSRLLWTAFLREGRSQIVAYVLLSILPKALVDRRGAALGEAYERSVDEILTPLWSRFYFHLVAARDQGTLMQLLWTFDYAKGFVDILNSFITDVIADQTISKLLEFNKNAVSGAQVMEKFTRFMRAHVAEYVVILSPLSRGAALAIVESSLELDYFVCGFSPVSQHISDVICDMKAAFQLWMDADASFSLNRLQQLLTIGKGSPYDLRFENDSVRLSEADSHGVIAVIPSRYMTAVNCFSVVYEILWLLTNAFIPRYQFVSQFSQDLIIEKIFEPLLCCLLGAVLFRIRTDPVLVALSKGQSDAAYGDVEAYFSGSMSQVLQSVAYAVSSLSQMDKLGHMVCKRDRLENLWRRTRSRLSAASMFSLSAAQVRLEDIFDLCFSVKKDPSKPSPRGGAADQQGSEPRDQGTMGEDAGYIKESSEQPAGDAIADGNASSSSSISAGDRKLAEVVEYATSQLMLICEGLTSQYKEITST